MPKVNWGISSGDVDDFDRDSQYKPYTGPIPPNAVYEWKIKVLQSVAGSREKNPQLRVGLELAPREGRKDERQYGGYFVMAFIPISAKTQFRYVPFLDAIGVSGREFTNGTVTDEDGNIRKIGRWRNDGEQYIAAQLKDGTDQDGNTRKEIGWMGEIEEDDDEYPDDGYDEEIGDDEYEDEDPV